jgi:hypothetical protein
MAAAFYPISKAEMESFLLPQGFKPLSLDGTRELVYGKRVDCDGLALSLRVYTGINPDGNSRDVGADAIRCNMFWRTVVKDENGEAQMDSNGQPVTKLVKVWTSKRVHRVLNWESNLAARLAEAKIERKCSCGSPMVKRSKKGSKEFFLGCASFPTCNNTERVS